MPDISRVNPLNIAPGIAPDSAEYLKHVVQSITMCVRVGNNTEAPLGYIQDFQWSIDRPATELYQIEAVPDGTFAGPNSGYSTNDGLFYSTYWPGEVIEQIPGKQGSAKLSIKRCTLYGSNLLSALMQLQGAGTEENGAVGTELDQLSFDASQATNFAQYVSLIQQIRPVYIKQMFLNPVTGKLAFGRVFQECWITSMSEALPNASKNEAVIEDMKLQATRIRPMVKP
jgi:hypothetical protein